VADVPTQAGVPGAVSGRQRRHGLNPASWAVAAQGRNTQLARFGVRAGQTGRQNTPVLVTPTKKRPSKRSSRVEIAL